VKVPKKLSGKSSGKLSGRSASQLRIIAGNWRGRKLNFTAQDDLRPTPDRVRETLFNWLQSDIAGSHCLDCFAGSGALGFEAASRGAELVSLVDANSRVTSDLLSNKQSLQADSIDVVTQDVIQFLQTPSEQRYDLVFLDPPFQSDLLQRSAALLERQHWLTNHAKIYIEVNSKSEFAGSLPASWRQLKSSRAGQVAYSLWQRSD